MTEIVDIRSANDPRDVVHRAVHALSQGELVGLPTETGYVAAASLLRESAVERLFGLSAGANGSPGIIGLRGEPELDDYVLRRSAMGERMTRRCWPGPVVVQLPVSGDEGLLRAVPRETRELIIRDGEARFQESSDAVCHDVLKLLPAPVVTRTLDVTGKGVAVAAADLVARSQGMLALCIDEGPSRFDQPSTVVRIDGDNWDVVQEGVVSRQTVSRLTRRMVLFVCTGNTCRSPMAEGLFRKSLAERLQCTEEELDGRGHLVLSAGLSAVPGLPASVESVEALRKCGIDLTEHASRPATAQLLRQADVIYTMTRAHRESILSSHPELGGKTELLSREGRDISDPIGQSAAAYLACKEEIERNVRQLVESLVP